MSKTFLKVVSRSLILNPSKWVHNFTKLWSHFEGLRTRLLLTIFIFIFSFVSYYLLLSPRLTILSCMAEQPVMCWCAIKKPLTHSRQTDWVVSKTSYVFTFFTFFLQSPKTWLFTFLSCWTRFLEHCYSVIRHRQGISSAHVTETIQSGEAVSARGTYTGQPSNVVTVKSDSMAWLTSSKLNSLLRHSRSRARAVSFTNTKYSPLATTTITLGTGHWTDAEGPRDCPRHTGIILKKTSRHMIVDSL